MPQEAKKENQTDEIISERLRLEIITGKDAADVFHTMNTQSTADMVSFLKWPMTMDQAQNWCEHSMREYKTRKEFLFIARNDSAPVGCIGIHKKPERKAEVGYWVAGDKQGLGYASEMLKAAIAFAFRQPDIDGLWATAAIANDKSQRVLEKLGFVKAGTKSVPTAKGHDVESHTYELAR